MPPIIIVALPDNHASKFPASWWNARRSRDYYVDAMGCVQLRPDSETGRKFAATLVRIATSLRRSGMPLAQRAF